MVKNELQSAPKFALLLCLLALPAGARPPTFQHEIRPVFESQCFGCHGDKQKMGGLDLRSITSVLAGGSGGPAIKPGSPEQSLLWKVIDSGKMPMGGKPLSDDHKRLIRAWIEQGRFPSLDAALDEKRLSLITPEARAFWSFRKPVKPAVPQVKANVRTPVDAFLLRELESKGWSFNPEADRRTLIRRAYFDLLGLPPSPEEVVAFAADKSPAAYERLIDRLLESPHYGERWGRHWLDVAGYSDSVGNAEDELRPKSWQYRDYVIRSFNADKPYNQFLLEQFAGDQLVNYEPGTRPKPDQMEKLVATGFLRLAPDLSDTQTIYQVDKWFDALQATMETSMKAVVGLQLACARCHDHKFDPILQSDYYKITAAYQAAFDPENWIPAALGFGHWPTRYILDADGDQQKAYAKAALEDFPKIRRERGQLRREYSKYRQIWREQRTVNAAKVQTSAPAGSDDEEETQAADISDSELEKLYPELAQKANEVRAKEKAYEDLTPDRIWALWDVSKEPSPTYLLVRGNYLAPGPAVKPGILTVLDDPAKQFQFPDPKPEWHHTGRRLTLARWLTQPDHPLTTRVVVNRIWQFHFGEGIVRTPDDFGSQGMRPTHPELLDWLATSFVDNGWSWKWLHRQIMLSNAYRQSSAEDPAKLALDPSNKLHWRKSPLRLEAEVIRDSTLKISGLLQTEMFGEYTPLRKAPDGQWVEDFSNPGAMRRSLYLLNRRTAPHGFLNAFDAPAMDNGNMPQRFRSALPVQSLALMNNAALQKAAAALAQRIREESKSDAEKSIRRAFELAYSRPPGDRELQIAHRILAGQPDKGWRILCQVLLASNEFLYSF
jgi:hypothetical protein